MKRLKILISCITAAFLLLGCFQFSFAASAELLFNMNGKTVYSDTSLAQIYDICTAKKNCVQNQSSAEIHILLTVQVIMIFSLLKQIQKVR